MVLDKVANEAQRLRSLLARALDLLSEAKGVYHPSSDIRPKIESLLFEAGYVERDEIEDKNDA